MRFLRKYISSMPIVDKGGHTPPPFSNIPPFLEIQDVPTFHRSFGKIKVLKNSCNQSLVTLVISLYEETVS